jgi:beta-phosphoglucomutase-like phosphatase (HAD superfamily)
LVVEDAIAGIEAAHAGNMDSAGLGEAANYRLTTYRLESFSGLLSIFQ